MKQGIALRIKGKTKITAKPGLRARPVYDMVKAMRPLGAHVITTNGYLNKYIQSEKNYNIQSEN